MISDVFSPMTIGYSEFHFRPPPDNFAGCQHMLSGGTFRLPGQKGCAQMTLFPAKNDLVCSSYHPLLIMGPAKPTKKCPPHRCTLQSEHNSSSRVMQTNGFGSTVLPARQGTAHGAERQSNNNRSATIAQVLKLCCFHSPLLEALMQATSGDCF